jgi:hypothetical protein
MNKKELKKIIDEIFDQTLYLYAYAGDDEKAKKEAEEKRKEGYWNADTYYDDFVAEKCDNNIINMYNFLNKIEEMYKNHIQPLLKICREETGILETIKMKKECKKNGN